MVVARVIAIFQSSHLCRTGEITLWSLWKLSQLACSLLLATTTARREIFFFLSPFKLKYFFLISSNN